MSILTALLLGLIQGLTEFLPVSSSAHLFILKNALGASNTPLFFDLCCHMGTLFALLFFLRKEILSLFFEPKQFGHLLVALAPLIPCALVLENVRGLVSSPSFLGIFLIGTGAILILGESLRFKMRKSRVFDSLLIGAVQSVALLPGISRSASTISCARMLGWEPKKAVRFSFLLAIPTIFGGSLLEMKHLWGKKQIHEVWTLPCLIGLLVSFAVGLVVIRYAFAFLEKGKLKPIAWYCMILGAGWTLTQFWIQ